MAWEKPSPTAVWRAIDIYMAHAYEGPAPSAVRARLKSLQAAPPAELFDSPVFERDTAHPACWFSLRLGNHLYPHMKLRVERCPDGSGYLLRVDTHDRHITPSPSAKDRHLFQQLVERNLDMAGAIEHEWVQCGLPVFSEFLRKDLLRRAGGAAQNPPGRHPDASGGPSFRKPQGETRTARPTDPTMSA